MGGRHRNSTPSRGNGGAKQVSREQAGLLARLLAEKWPDAHVELDHQNAYQLLVATILAAQSTDKLINTVTPTLFAAYPDPNALAQADQGELEKMVAKTGFFRMKAKHLIGMAQAVVIRHGGQIPNTMAELCALPGVARKTANVVLGSALGVHVGFVVDTHVTRLAQRLHLSSNTDPVKIEQDLMAILPQEEWTPFAHRLIWLGRRICTARKPDCEHCMLAPHCPSAFRVEVVPVANPRAQWRKAAKAKAAPHAPAKRKPAKKKSR